MNRWVLLEHKTFANEVHYDFLIENGADCLTWKLFAIPSTDVGMVKIKNQPNHRLIWLTRLDYELSNDRGHVRRIDHGTYKLLSNDISFKNIIYLLNGEKMNGKFIIENNLCNLIK